jgi:RNA polymerase sigma factor (sigma-70 family)
MKRREKYLEERDRANGKVSFSALRLEDADRDSGFCDEGINIEDDIINSVFMEELSVAISCLSREERDILHKIFWLGMRVQEIADAASVSRKRVVYKRNSALGKLRKALGITVEVEIDEEDPDEEDSPTEET